MNLPIEQLKEYLSMVIDTENNLILQENAIKGIEKKQSVLMDENTFVEPTRERPKLNSFALLCGLILLGITRIYGIFKGSWVVAIVVTVIWVSSRYKADTKKIEEKYQQEMAAYEAAVKADKYRVSKETKKYMMLDTDKISMKMQHLSTLNVLKELYSADILYPKYHNLAMIASIYEYLDSGRCETLEGRDGAYNILETEMRLDRIIVNLDNIVYKLDGIMTNQRTLYDALSQTYENTEKLVKSIDDVADKIAFQNDKLNSVDVNKLRESSELAAYSAERASKELHYMNWMKHMNGEYKYSNMFNLPE